METISGIANSLLMLGIYETPIPSHGAKKYSLSEQEHYRGEREIIVQDPTRTTI
jgi:hypothetical protein